MERSADQRGDTPVGAHADFADLYVQTRMILLDLGEQWGEGLLSARSFTEAMDEVLLAAHTRAVVIGRTHGGDDAPEDDDDRRFAEIVVQGEHGHLAPFRQQLEAGVYTGADGVRQGGRAARRAASYSSRLVGTANEAFFLTLPQDTLLWWECLEDEASCPDCPEMEAASPWLISEIPFHVGMNATQCLVNCRCRERTESGLEGFHLPAP